MATYASAVILRDARKNALLRMRSERFSPTSKLRRTFFRKRLDAFLDLLAAHAFAMAAVGGALVELAAREFIDGPFHAAHGHRRVAGKDGRQPVDLFVERLGRHHGGEIADPQHFRGADLLGGQEQFLGVVDPEACDVARDAALVIVQPETRRRHEHFASVDADAEVAGQRQISRAAIDAAVEPADGRHPDVLEPVDDDFKRRSGAFFFNGADGALGDRVEIITSTEGAAGAGEHQHPDRRIGLDPVEQFQENVEIVGLQPVQMFRPVETDIGARTVKFEHRLTCRGFRHEPLRYLFSCMRRLASASIVSARSGWRAISRRKSTRSSTNSLDTCVVVMLAERRLLPSNAISPKNAPSPSVTFLPGRSTSTSPSAMKYMQSPT